MENRPRNEADDGRLEYVQSRLNEAFLETRQGDYFRSRVHGWLAERAGVDVDLPASLSKRLRSPFEFDQSYPSFNLSTLDAFVICYHAAESLVRHMLATIDGSGPGGAPLIALTLMRTGREFSERRRALLALPRKDLISLLDYVFLPDALKRTWSDEPPSITAVQGYCLAWVQHLVRYTLEWQDAYNAAKHGLAVGAQSTQLMFVPADAKGSRPVSLMNGPVLRTLEFAKIYDDEGRRVTLPDGSPAVRWSWVYRAVDPDELIAITLVVADLFDWMGAVSRARLAGEGQHMRVRDRPMPQSLHRMTAPGLSFRVDIGTMPLPPEQAEAVVSLLRDGDDEGVAS